MPPPTYILRKTEISLLCGTPESDACAELVRRRDKKGDRESDFWGHPSFDGMPDGTLLVRLPLNVRNMAVLHECGAVPSREDAETARRMAFFRTRAVPFLSALELRPFQREGASWLLGRDLRAILAFGVGLGKTVTSFAVILSDPARFLPAVVLAPAHVKLNWGDEWVKWGGSAREAAVLFGRTPEPAELAGRKLVVLNHHIVAGWADALIAAGPKTLVIDEAHNFVNSNTKTYPVVERIARACDGRVLMLTATPLVNNLGDLWGLCNLIRPDILGLKGVFNDTFMPEEREKQKLLASRWTGGFGKSAGWRDVARARLPKELMARRKEELREILHRTVVLRKRKSEVIDQLPEITETHLRIEIPETTDEGAAFWKIEQKCVCDIAEAKDDILASGKGLAAATLAKRNAAFAKLPYAEEWLRDFLSESEDGEKVVVAGWSVEPLERLHAIFKKESVLVNGDVDAKKKSVLGKRFANEPDKRILFGNYKSIGTGIDTLVAASTMLILELPLTSVDLEQVKGRTDRLSQKSNHLAYYYMTVKDTIEEKRGWAIIRQKKKLADDLGL